MGIKKVILHVLLTIEAFFLQFFKIVPNRITFITLAHDRPFLDFKVLSHALDKEKYDVRFCFIKYEKSLIGQFQYFINCFKQLFYVYTSRIIILNDNNYVVSNFKRKQTIVLQVWHACGAIKKFGNAIDREYSISNYDYVLATSSYWKKPYSEAFGVKEENVLPIGMPRTDRLINEEFTKKSQNKIYEKYPQLKGKKVILYAPTFRGNIYKGFNTVPFDAQKIIDAIGDDYVLLYKHHPLLGNVDLGHNDHIMNMNGVSTHKLFLISDYLISDYSSIVFDYMILEKPILFYVPDLDEYMDDLGVYVDVRNLGYPICMNEDELIRNIKDYPTSKEVCLKNKNTFVEIQDGKSVERVIQLIESFMK